MKCPRCRRGPCTIIIMHGIWKRCSICPRIALNAVRNRNGSRVLVRNVYVSCALSVSPSGSYICCLRVLIGMSTTDNCFFCVVLHQHLFIFLQPRFYAFELVIYLYFCTLRSYYKSTKAKSFDCETGILLWWRQWWKANRQWAEGRRQSFSRNARQLVNWLTGQLAINSISPINSLLHLKNKPYLIHTLLVAILDDCRTQMLSQPGNLCCIRLRPRKLIIFLAP